VHKSELRRCGNDTININIDMNMNIEVPKSDV
jgi:hypothetical protein